MEKEPFVDKFKLFLYSDLNNKMLEFTAGLSGNTDVARSGWEKWLQFQFALYFHEDREYKYIKLEDSLNGKRVDISYKDDEGDELINAIELKVARQQKNIIKNMKNDIQKMDNKLTEKCKNNFEFKSVAFIGITLSNNLDESVLSKNIVNFELIRPDNQRWSCIIIRWVGQANNRIENYYSFKEFLSRQIACVYTD